MELELNLIEQGQNIIRHGGLFIWCVVAISIAALVISLERFWILKIQYRLNGRKLFDTVKRNLIEGNIRGAEEACEAHPGVPLAQLMHAGVSAAARRGKLHQLDIAVESELLNSIPLISQRLNYLPSLANVATLFGLLGTIAGLIVAFRSTGGAGIGGMSQEQGLAAGIAVAMYNTAFGLVVAIPTTLSYLYLSNSANALMDDLERYASAFKRLVTELGLVVNDGVSAEAVRFEKNSGSADHTASAQAAIQDRLDRAQREVALESKTPSAVLSSKDEAVRKNVKAPSISKPAAMASRPAPKKEDATLILDAESRISVTHAIRPEDVVKPFSEETEKRFVTASKDLPSVSDRLSSEKTKISTRDRSGLEEITDELTTPELPGVRKP